MAGPWRRLTRTVAERQREATAAASRTDMIRLRGVFSSLDDGVTVARRRGVVVAVLAMGALVIAAREHGADGQVIGANASVNLFLVGALVAGAFVALRPRLLGFVLTATMVLSTLYVITGDGTSRILTPTLFVLALGLRRIDAELPGGVRTLRLGALTAAAALVSLLTFTWTLGPLDPEGSGGGGGGTDGGSTGGQTAPGDAFAGGARGLRPPDPFTWWWWLLVLALVAALVVAWLLLRRRRPPTAERAVADRVARLDRIGARIGAPRGVGLGPMAYGAELDGLVGDRRLASAGTAISALLYRPAGPDPVALQSVDGLLADLEHRPPPRLPRPPLWRRAATVVSPRRHPVVYASLLLLGVAVAWTIRRDDPDAPRWHPEDHPTAAVVPGRSHQWELCSRDAGLDQQLVGLYDADTGETYIETSYPNEAAGTGPVRSAQWSDGTTLHTRTAAAGRSQPWIDLETAGRDIGLTDALLDRDRLVEALALDGMAAVVETDPTGAPYERFERLPDDPYGPSRVGPRTSLEGALLFGGQGLVRAVDVWSDPRGRVYRVRTLTQDPEPSWTELRMIAEPWDEPVPSPRNGAWLSLPGRCGPELDDGGRWMGPAPWDQRLSVPVRVSLDDDGRPFDVRIRPDEEVTTDAIGTITTGGSLVVVDATDLGDPPAASVDTVALDGSGELSVEVIGRPIEDWFVVDGIRLDRLRSDPVVRWRRPRGLDGSYGVAAMDADVAGVSSGAGAPAVEVLGGTPVEDLLWETTDRSHLVTDIDGDGADDTVAAVVYPAGRLWWVEGVDARGQVVSWVLWGRTAPWRLAIPEGEPPPAVSRREHQLQECIDGTRPVDAYGECATSG